MESGKFSVAIKGERLLIRKYTPGDKQYVVESHYKIYQKEFNYDQSFKAFVKKGLEDFDDRLNTEKECIWILQINGNPMGSIGVTMFDEHTAQLRWFLVDPSVRGEGYGSDLIKKAIDFCRKRGYKKILLWTNEDLQSARRLYQKFGFQISETKKQFLSGQWLTEEKWELNVQK